VTVMINSHTAY